MRRSKLVYLHILLNSFMSNWGGHDCSFSILGGHDCSFLILWGGEGGGGHVPPVPPPAPPPMTCDKTAYLINYCLIK